MYIVAVRARSGMEQQQQEQDHTTVILGRGLCGILTNSRLQLVRVEALYVPGGQPAVHNANDTPRTVMWTSQQSRDEKYNDDADAGVLLSTATLEAVRTAASTT